MATVIDYSAKMVPVASSSDYTVLPIMRHIAEYTDEEYSPSLVKLSFHPYWNEIQRRRAESCAPVNHLVYLCRWGLLTELQQITFAPLFISTGYGPAAMSAAIGGHLPVLHWLSVETKERKISWDVSCTATLLEHCTVEALQWIDRHNCRSNLWSAAAVDNIRTAIKHGRLDALVWLDSLTRFMGSVDLVFGPVYCKAIKLTEATCAYAAETGQLAILQWMRQRHADWDKASARKWATIKPRSEPVPWNSFTCSAAAKNGHLHVLQWAISAGCLYNSYVCQTALRGKHYHIVRWMHRRDCRCQMSEDWLKSAGKAAGQSESAKHDWDTPQTLCAPAKPSSVTPGSSKPCFNYRRNKTKAIYDSRKRREKRNRRKAEKQATDDSQAGPGALPVTAAKGYHEPSGDAWDD